MMRIKLNHLAFTCCLLLYLFAGCKNGQVQETAGELLRSVPEKEKVSSEGIIEFLRAAEASPHEFHSIMILRHGNVIAEGWWHPYRPELKQTLYSASKSFTSTAIGFAVAEKRLKVTDKVITFFPESLPENVSPNLADMEIRDLLCMAAGQEPDPTNAITSAHTDWIKAFLARPVVNDPGTKFLYNSMATYMLSAIIQKITGETLIDYLTPRLFEPLGIRDMDWETDPAGINTGGWGLRVKTEDMARFGQLYLQEGMWNGKKILPESWIREATTFKIDQAPKADESEKESNDWLQGYCYQFWRCRNNAFRGDGAFGQYIIVLPEKDAVIAITSETQNMQGILDLVWEYLLPAMKDEKLPENPSSHETLKSMLSDLSLPAPVSTVNSELIPKISGNTYALEPNSMNIESVTIAFNDNICTVTINNGKDNYKFGFGKDSWNIGETLRPGPNLLFSAQGHFKGYPPVKVACSYSWLDENTLTLIIRYIESPHTEYLTCVFDKDSIYASVKISFRPENEPVKLKGKIVQP